MEVHAKHVFVGLIAALTLVASCESAEETASPPQKPTSPTPAPKPAPAKPSRPLVPHKVLGGDTIPGVKRSVDVQLEGPIEEAELRALALALKAQEDQRYDRTGLRLDPLEKSSTGDHYVITKAGALESRDRDGLISSSSPAK